MNLHSGFSMPDETEELAQRRPTHPGVIIKTQLLPNSGLSEFDVGSMLGLDTLETSKLLSGKRALTRDDVRRLRKSFGLVATTLGRLQATVDFFDKNLRRPNSVEKRKIYSLDFE